MAGLSGAWGLGATVVKEKRRNPATEGEERVRYWRARELRRLSLKVKIGAAKLIEFRGNDRFRLNPGGID
ncbi:MAG: hypothetical protein ACYTFG_04850, partial [Planctomycetota bacterium]